MNYKLTDNELRSICKEKIESLEYWIRRVIDETLTKNYGNYFHYKDSDQNRLIKNNITKNAEIRKSNEPERYPRLIDAILLDECIDIICKPNLYKDHFCEMFEEAFPDGREVTRTFLKRLIAPRNALSHANPISMRQAEQVICYSNDITDSIKNYYTRKNMDNEYNVPLILKVIDSFGNTYHRSQIVDKFDGTIRQNFYNNSALYLRVGDTLTLEVEVDPSFEENEYTINWSSAKGFADKIPSGKKAIIKITEGQVSQKFDVQCRVKSNKGWHRLTQGIDDFMILSYKVLPPQ